MESIYAAFKASLVPVNVNYRYQAEELRYLLDNSDAEIVVVHEDFAPLLEEVLPDLPQVMGVLVVGESGEYDIASIASAAPYEVTAEGDRPAVETKLSPDDLLLLYTGGTTGMPKGVIWRQGDFYARFGGGGIGATPENEEAYREFVKSPPIRYRSLICPPLMHGTGWFQAMIAWLVGGVVVVLESAKKFDPAELWRTVDAEKINSITIVGDRVRHQQRGHDRVVRGDVERGDQAAVAGPPLGPGAGRRLQLLGGRRHGHELHHRNGLGADGEVPALGHHEALQRRPRTHRERARGAGPGGRRWPPAHRLLQGSGEEREDLR
jgi:hypothetical protein